MTKDWAHGVGHSPVCQILLQTVMRAVITSSPPAWTSSAGMLSTQADFPFFNDCTAASTSLRRMGLSSSVSVLGQSSTDGSPLALWLYSSVQYYVHRFSISGSSVRHFPERSRTIVAFSWFTVVKSFTSWYALSIPLMKIYYVYINFPHNLHGPRSLLEASISVFHLWKNYFALLYTNGRVKR